MGSIMKQNKTVLISGLGIAGPALAYWLKAAGFEPTLIERAPRLRSGGYVIDFWGLGYDVTERMGLEGSIRRAGYQARELRIVDGTGDRVTGFGTNVFRELTSGRYVTLARSELSRLLYEKIAETSELILDNEIVGLRESDEAVVAKFKRGGDRSFDLVIGADGLHSQVRTLTFGPQHNFEKRLGYAVAAFESQGYEPRNDNVYVMYALPGRMVGRFALHQNKTLFLFVFTTDSDGLPQELEDQKQFLCARYNDGKWECPQILHALDEAQELYLDRVSQIQLPNWSRGRIALVGDAAFCISLLAGQGAALAITSAYVLAGELLKAEGHHERAFRQYEDLLRNYVETKQRGAQHFASAFAPKTQLGLWFRNQVIKTFAIPGLARLTIGGDIVDTLRLEDYRW
jgi:2-polyprenyl-6-methoxyphenol hydroxylase-like FAD-dependent oxidoreductase